MTTTFPPAQRNAAMAYDPIENHIVLYDGFGVTWVYEAGAWRPLDTLLSPGEINTAVLVYNPARQSMLLFGGGTGLRFFNDTWELYNGEWHLLPNSGEPPPPRSREGAAFIDADATFVMFGGISTLGYLNDTWLFQSRSSTADENCTNNADDDTDQQVDATDPDCQR